MHRARGRRRDVSRGDGMTRTLILSHVDLVYNRGPYVEGYQRRFNHTRSHADYFALRRALHEQMQLDNAKAEK